MKLFLLAFLFILNFEVHAGRIVECALPYGEYQILTLYKYKVIRKIKNVIKLEVMIDGKFEFGETVIITEEIFNKNCEEVQ